MRNSNIQRHADETKVITVYPSDLIMESNDTTVVVTTLLVPYVCGTYAA